MYFSTNIEKGTINSFKEKFQYEAREFGIGSTFLIFLNTCMVVVISRDVSAKKIRIQSIPRFKITTTCHVI